jgi:Predicted metal-binding, possibly nucleic acid-binding protein
MPTLNLKEIFKTTARFSGFYKIKPEELNLPPELGELKEPVEVEVQIEKVPRGYEVHLSIKGNIKLECSRCLTPFVKELESTEILRLEKYPEKPSISLSTQDLNVFFLEDEENFNLADLVREQIILSIPIKPLCRVDCQIPTLEEPDEDTRFGVLKKFIQTKNSL